MEQEGMMYFVNPKDVIRAFKSYLEDYGDMISKESAIEELKDALNSAKMEWIDRENE
jgi:hypothetical protein